MTTKDTAKTAETYRLLIADKAREINDLKSLKGILAYAELLLGFQRKQAKTITTDQNNKMKMEESNHG